MTRGDVTWAGLLEGLAGALVAGLITGLALFFTIRHERRLQRDVALEAAAVRLAGSALALSMVVASRPKEDALLDPYTRFLAALTEVLARSRRGHKAFNACVLDLWERTRRRLQIAVESKYQEGADDLVHAIWTLHATATRWLADSKEFESDQMTAETMLESTRQDFQ